MNIPQNGSEEGEGKATGRHQNVKEQDVNDHESEKGERERNVAIDQKENRTDQLDHEYYSEEVRNEKRALELAGDAGGGEAWG